MSSIDDMNSIGFKELFKNDNTCEYNIYADKKLHYFCNHVDKNGEIHIYNDSDKINGNSFSLFNKDEYKDKKTSIYSGNLDQIINVKRVDIIFNTNNEETKCYINDVVLEYLTQVIPSNVILEIKYEESKNYIDFDTYYSNYNNLKAEINESNQCNAKNGVISFFKPLGKFGLMTKEGRQDTESDCVIYPNIPLVLTPQSNINIDFEQYIYPQSFNNIYRTYDKNENKYKYYKWNHSGTDLEEII